jgi:hypothetical protein
MISRPIIPIFTRLAMEHPQPTYNYTTKPKKQKAEPFKDILLEFGLITHVSYEPFQPDLEQVARVLLATYFPQKLYLFNYFTLFFTDKLFQIIITNANRYASIR